ncbi:MAG: tRNA (guanosine(46)-N7)-methyltransferase TrmB [Alphaproteobacteria bacterium]|nr:tRNA (guanosine(46)-N7)-methyltransferase TrmB [Alphaproteobacteria bacterium]
MLSTSDKPKFYGRRQGRRIRKAKTSLLDKFLPQIEINKNTVFKKEKLFGIPVSEVYLEIGFGNGEHLAGQALRHPDIGFIGAEVFKNGVANLLSLITGVKEGADISDDIRLLPDRVDNIRVFGDDVRLLFERIPDAFIDKLFVLFPDPWPKKRHASRRFINPDNLREIARILKPGGILRVATDHKVYKGWTLRQLHACPDFRWTASCGNDWKREPSDWVETKYQRKAIAEGRRPVFLDFARKE